MEKIESGDNFIEQLREKVRIKLEKAMANPILESRLRELDVQLAKTEAEEKDFLTDEEIEAELMASSVFVDNLVEFHEVLRQLAAGYNQSDEWVKYMLAHENAHASVAIQTGHNWKGYAVLFVKNEMGNIVSVQPMSIHSAPKSWTREEVDAKSLEVLRAPELYGNSLSPFDITDIKKKKK